MKEIGGNINYQNVIENKNAIILWDFDIHTDRSIQANRPDIVVKNHNDKSCFLIDMSVPIDTNVSLKIFEKLSKYKDLEIEVSKMWQKLPLIMFRESMELRL